MGLEQEPEYVYHKFPDESFEVRQGTRCIGIGNEDQDFLDYLTWISNQKDRETHPFLVREKTVFFCDSQKLFEYLRDNAMFLYVERSTSSGHTREIPHTPLFHINQIYHFQNMPMAGTIKSNPEFNDTGYGGSNKSGFHSLPSNIYLTKPLIAQLNELLPEDAVVEGKVPIRRVSNWPIERCFVYIDVSDFSKMPPGHQALVVSSIVKVFQAEPYWFNYHAFRGAKEDVEAMICIGDGYIFVLKDPRKAVIFGAYLAHLIEIFRAKDKHPVDYHFRMGAHVGKVFTFWDPGRKNWNYIGDGINGGQRILGAVGKETDDIFVNSGQLRDRIAGMEKPDSYPDLIADARNRGRHADKHGTPWRFYEINHSQLRGYTKNIV